MYRLLLVVLMTSMLLLVTPAVATTLNLTVLPVNTYGGYYVGPAGGNLNGVTSLWVTCNDFNHTSHIPSSFDVDISTIPSLEFARFGHDAIALDNYQRAVWLMWQIVLGIHIWRIN